MLAYIYSAHAPCAIARLLASTCFRRVPVRRFSFNSKLKSFLFHVAYNIKPFGGGGRGLIVGGALRTTRLQVTVVTVTDRAVASSEF